MNTLLKKKPAKTPPPKAKKKKPAAQRNSQEKFSLKRLLMGEEKPDLTELESGSTTILDILSPTTVDTKSRDYIVVDGVYHAYLYVTGYGYATTVGSCWLAPLVEAGEGVNLSFIFRRQPKDKILSKIAQTTMVNRSRMRDVEDTRKDFEELDSAISFGLYLKDVMNRQGEDFYYMHTLLEVVADDPEPLEQRVTAVEKLCISIDMIARRCDYKNEQAFLSALPLLALDPDVERKSRRNALTSGVAAAFPFASYELSDRNGVFLGLNLYNRSPVFLDPYDDYKYTNGNCWIGGSSGAGKTFTLQCLGGRLRQQGRRVIFIVPKKGHEFRPLCELLGGLYLRMSPSSRDCPNIMAIRRKSLDSYAGLRDMAARDDSVLADKISRLIIWYSLQKRDLSDEDKNYLDSSLVECYRQYGITFDNDTITDETGAFVEMRIIADWYKVLAENPETKHLSVVLARYVTGSASAMGQRNDIDLDNKYVVLDTSGMPDDLLLPGIFWATDIANDLIMDSREDLFIYIDKAIPLSHFASGKGHGINAAPYCVTHQIHAILIHSRKLRILNRSSPLTNLFVSKHPANAQGQHHHANDHGALQAGQTHRLFGGVRGLRLAGVRVVLFIAARGFGFLRGFLAPEDGGVGHHGTVGLGHLAGVTGADGVAGGVPAGSGPGVAGGGGVPGDRVALTVHIHGLAPLHISQGQGLALVLNSFGDEGGVRFRQIGIAAAGGESP